MSRDMSSPCLTCGRIVSHPIWQTNPICRICKPLKFNSFLDNKGDDMKAICQVCQTQFYMSRQSPTSICEMCRQAKEKEANSDKANDTLKRAFVDEAAIEKGRKLIEEGRAAQLARQEISQTGLRCSVCHKESSYCNDYKGAYMCQDCIELEMWREKEKKRLKNLYAKIEVEREDIEQNKKGKIFPEFDPKTHVIKESDKSFKFRTCTPTHDPVNRPDHYNSHPSGIECIQVTEHMSFNIGNAVKYLWRYKGKNGLEDLKKARWYINREIDKMEKENGQATNQENNRPKND